LKTQKPSRALHPGFRPCLLGQASTGSGVTQPPRRSSERTPRLRNKGAVGARGSSWKQATGTITRSSMPGSGRSGVPGGREGERHFGCGRQSRCSRISAVDGPGRRRLPRGAAAPQASPSGGGCAANRLSQRERPTTVWSSAGFLQARWKSGRDRKCPSCSSFGGKSSPSRWRLGDRASSAMHVPLDQ
jgi:hypothetical protein